MGETNAERVRVLRDLHNRRLRLSSDSIKWLIEQTELVPELERNNKLLKGQKGIKTELNIAAVRIIEEKEQENKRLREALRKIKDLEPLDHVVINEIARKALEVSQC